MPPTPGTVAAPPETGLEAWASEPHHERRCWRRRQGGVLPSEDAPEPGSCGAGRVGGVTIGCCRGMITSEPASDPATEAVSMLATEPRGK